MKKKGVIFYEGYKNINFYRNGSKWMMNERLPLRLNEASLEVEMSDAYPIGVFKADIFDKRG